MTKKSTKLITTLLVFTSRLVQLPANFSPLGSFGFFGNNAFLYFGTIIAFDALRGGFYSGFLFTYLGFAMYYILGQLTKSNTKHQLLALPAASFLFFLLSNLGVWYYWYPHTLDGLLTCYTLAIPFYRNTLLGDLVFGYGFIGLKQLLNSIKKTAFNFNTRKLQTK